MLLISPAITTYILIITALVGLVMGSFINCWAWRSIQGESVVAGRSHCATCGHDLSMRDLIPLVSWFAAKGTCRYCGKRVSARYPLTEALCALVYVLIVVRYDVTPQAAELLVFASVLLFLSLTDIDAYLIPTGSIVVAVVARVLYLLYVAVWQRDALQVELLASLIGCIALGGVIALITIIADKVLGRESMGGGDIKLFAVAGLYFGWQQGLLLVIIACVIGLVVAVLSQRSTQSADKPGDSVGQADVAMSSNSADQGNIFSAGEIVDQANVLDPSNSADKGKTHNAGEVANQADIPDKALPFGPSIAAACVLVMLVGQPLLSGYLNLAGLA